MKIMLLRMVNKGFSMIEIIIAFSILAMAMIPVFSMLQSGSQKTSFSDYYIFAHIRAMRIADAVASYPYDQLIGYSNLGSTDKLIQIDAAGMEIPEEYQKRLNQAEYAEDLLFREIDDGIGKLEVNISWKFFGPGQKLRTYTLQRLIRRRDYSLSTNFNLQS
ncbi:MAG: prepilin-type N-terminal cleavage/methylation domain-containing protein [bacterium]|nr:prepilin-type N-terminal cleavage/methylation domain-containing protein [bacterium]